MDFNYFYKSDIGTTRESNQDSVYAETVKTPSGKAFLGMVCDGMGGLSKGGFASNMLVETFRNWFKNEFSENTVAGYEAGIVFGQWAELIGKANNALIEMSRNFGEQMGSTLSALLIFNGEYYAAQVGDSRIYLCSNNILTPVTTDHSYVMEMVSKGMMTETEARLSRKRNVLTRCIGVVKESYGDFYNGSVQSGDSFLISSDGFHGGTSEEEMHRILADLTVRRRHEVERRVNKYINARKRAGEKDNITALVVMVG